jgi:hypothetical protein
MVIYKNLNFHIGLVVQWTVLKHAFEYLGTFIIDGRYKTEVRSKIGQAKIFPNNEKLFMQETCFFGHNGIANIYKVNYTIVTNLGNK